MRILYKVFSKMTGSIAARLGKGVFKGIWARIDEREPPPPTALDASLPKVVGAATLEAATMAGVGALVERASAQAFKHLTGFSPSRDEDADS